MDTTYNGWTNYATWRVNLEFFDAIQLTDFLNCEPEDVQEWQGLNSSEMSQIAYETGRELKDYVEDALASNSSGVAFDYALAFVAGVNWTEIAQHMISEATRAA